jgi:DNA polymerase-1
MTDTLVLIDGHALVFRAFYGVPNLTSPKGELVNAVHGFTSMLFKAWRGSSRTSSTCWPA